MSHVEMPPVLAYNSVPCLAAVDVSIHGMLVMIVHVVAAAAAVVAVDTPHVSVLTYVASVT